MRTIKFRGQRTDNGEWVYGDLITLKVGEKTASFIVVDNNAVVDHKLPPMAILFTLNKDIFMVKPETVGQFTGLHDRNGKEIYEGDIICMHTKRYGDETFIIAYEDSHLGAFSLCEGDVYSRFVCVFGKDYGYEPFYCEVIGNIYDNPELIEKGE